jgi:hypothetical protein
MFLILAHGRTERGRLYSLFSVAFSLSPSPHPSSLIWPLNPLHWPSKAKSRPTIVTAQAKSYRAPPPLKLKAPVPSTIVSGVVCRERRGRGSAGGGAHAPFSSLPVSLRLTPGTDICANPPLTFRIAGLNALVLFIPLAWASHFHEWAHGLTFARMS